MAEVAEMAPHPVVAVGLTGSGRDAAATVFRAAFPEVGERRACGPLEPHRRRRRSAAPSPLARAAARRRFRFGSPGAGRRSAGISAAKPRATMS